MPRLEIRLFGNPEFRIDGEPLTLSHRRETVPLVAYLLLAARNGATRAVAASEIWPNEHPEKARTMLRHAIHRTLASLEAPAGQPPWLLVDRTEVRWNPDSDFWLDVDVFFHLTEAIGTAQSALPERSSSAAAEDLEQAVRLYRGELAATLDHDWLAEPRARCQQRHLALVRRLAYCYEVGGRVDDARVMLEQVLSHDPSDEDAARRLMGILAGAGDRTSALQLYERLYRFLADEYGTEPEPLTVALRDSLRQTKSPVASEKDLAKADAELKRQRLDSDTPARDGHVRVAPRLGLPAVTALVGRDEERQSLRKALHESRLATVVGPPGVGKSTLANVVVHELLSRYGDGIVWLDGAELGGVKDLRRSIADVLEVLPDRSNEADNRSQTSEPRTKALVVFDNSTHLVEAIAAGIDRLARSRPQARFLVTAQAPLRLYGEQVVRLAFDPESWRFGPSPIVRGPGADEKTGGPPWQRSLGATCERSLGLLAADERAFVIALSQLPEVWLSLGDVESLVAGSAHASGAAVVADSTMADAVPTNRDTAISGVTQTGRAVAELLGVLVERSLVEASFTSEGATRFRVWPPLVAYVVSLDQDRSSP